MTTITYIGAGVMASGLTFPAFENGNTIRMVGTPLDRTIIDQLQKDNYHMRLKRVLHTGITYYQVEDLDVALEGADVVVCGVSSFGVDWFTEKVLPKIPPQSTDLIGHKRVVGPTQWRTFNISSVLATKSPRPFDLCDWRALCHARTRRS